MSWCQLIGPNARPPFVITPYQESCASQFEPVMPSLGPCGVLLDTPCRLAVHHRRERKTGPCFALTVVRCAVHDVSFTLYPPGHVPYGREALSPTAQGGQWIHAEPERGGEPPEPAHAFWGTFFDAALDAEQGRIGRREDSAGSCALWWSTQGRRLERAMMLLGLDSELALSERHALADSLSVDTLLLLDQARQVQARPGYRGRGQAICAVLSALQPGRWLPDRLAECGHRRGLWGSPYRWDPDTRQLRRRPFRWVDTRGPPD